ncbi:N-acetylmuramoyl-L-alanine amidase [Nakamurella sp. A5-74]|uniref:N-acetylmuramoyl-L-alanine amidase n=1 Tax=Nakamurella sp. A5-74 TaxID=3158264 RepID=A0AAU8DQI8_9ACTN
MTKKIVVIDPGHNGQNFEHPEIINKQVDAGFGQRKACNTTGTETNAGYTEALFNWKVSLQLKAALEARGITVVMTRDSNDGVGPCVNDRAAIGNNSEAAAVVSIHGDGDDASANGFYVMTAERDPAGSATAAQSARLADDVRSGLVNTGFSPSNHLGSDGLWKRGDLAGLNLSQKPTVMVEMGNMRNAGDAETMSSADGQQQYADGIAAGVVQYLIGR